MLKYAYRYVTFSERQISQLVTWRDLHTLTLDATIDRATRQEAVLGMSILVSPGLENYKKNILAVLWWVNER